MVGLGRVKVKCKNIFMELFFFLTEACPEGNPDLFVRSLFGYEIENSEYTFLRVLRMRRRELLDKEDEITMIDLPPNTTSFCVESGYQTPKKNPSPFLTQLVTA